MNFPSTFLSTKPASAAMLVALLAVFLPCVSTTVSADQMVDVAVSPWGIQVKALTPEVSFMVLRVVDPRGKMVYDQRSDGAPIEWSPAAGAPDGIYSYEVRAGKEKRKLKRDESQQEGPKIRPWTASGSVSVRDGAIVPSTEEESSLLRGISSAVWTAWIRLVDFIVPSAYAELISGDLYVHDSLCVGMDCVVPESFGYSTLKLKENNLQIMFEDTSSTATFPTNDWKIQINDTSNDGKSYFTIWDVDGGKRPFTIEAGAPSSSLYVNEYGNIGIGTSLPILQVHVVDGNTPGLRLDQDGSSGWAAQVWDIAGNEANFFIRDVTTGSNLPFRIQPGAPTSTLTLRADGKVGIGTWSPEAHLELETNGADNDILIQRVDGASGTLSAGLDKVIFGSKTNHPLTFVTNDSPVMTVGTGGNVVISGNLELGSSREIKQNIQEVEAGEAVYALNALRPVKFNYKTHPSEEVLGFVAEEVPNLVATESRLTTSPMDVVAVLAKVLQEQQKTIEELSRKVAELENDLKKRP